MQSYNNNNKNMGDNHRNSDSEALIIETNLYERYKKQKLQISSKFMKMVFRLGTILPLFLIVISSFIKFLYPIEILMLIVLSALSFTLQILAVIFEKYVFFT